MSEDSHDWEFQWGLTQSMLNESRAKVASLTAQVTALAESRDRLTAQRDELQEDAANLAIERDYLRAEEAAWWKKRQAIEAQRDAEKHTKTWLRKRLTDTEQTARTYAAQRDAAEKELVYKDEVIDLAHDRAIAAEKVCEAIKIIEHMHAPIDVDVDFCQRCTTAWPCATYKKAHAALAEWRKTKGES